MKKYVLLAACALLLMVALSSFAYAQPANATTITRGTSERASSGGAPSTQPSEAGNTTALNILATDTSRRWQGYYGNVTGNITLSDSSNNAMYNWVSANPVGEVYAANYTSVKWDKIFCVNFSTNADENLNKDTLNSFIGYTSDADKARKDSVNATFNQTFTGSLAVGSITLTGADNCSMVTLNTGSGYQTTQFLELLLTDNQSVVFASILEDNANGFKNHPTDFEMIVGVNGTATSVTRNYYFYVELN
jgi:hypothetical protein